MTEQTITGVCTEIAQRPGSEWVEFHIDSGGKYPVRLSTKLQPLIELGRVAGQQLATWTYNEVESDKINEKSGKPYVNRYLERVEMGGTQTQPDASASPTAAPPLATIDARRGSGEMTAEKWDAKERRDYRSRAWAQTISAFVNTIGTEEKPEDVYTRLKPFQMKVYYDVTGDWGVEEPPFD